MRPGPLRPAPGRDRGSAGPGTHPQQTAMVTCAGRAGPRDLAGPGGRSTIDRRMRPSDKGPERLPSGRRGGPGRSGVVIESDGDPLDQVEGLLLPRPVSIREVCGGGPALLRSIRLMSSDRRRLIRREHPLPAARGGRARRGPGRSRPALFRWWVGIPGGASLRSAVPILVSSGVYRDAKSTLQPAPKAGRASGEAPDPFRGVPSS